MSVNIDTQIACFKKKEELLYVLITAFIKHQRIVNTVESTQLVCIIPSRHDG